MLVNVCSCKWLRVHEECLRGVLRSRGTTCGVCQCEFAHSEQDLQDLSMAEQLYKSQPCLVVTAALCSLLSAFFALMVVCLTFFDAPTTPMIILCAFIMMYSTGSFLFFGQAVPQDAFSRWTASLRRRWRARRETQQSVTPV